MKDIIIRECNAYATSSQSGSKMRAIKVSGFWRLAKEIRPSYQWDFVNEIIYNSADEALHDVDKY